MAIWIISYLLFSRSIPYPLRTAIQETLRVRPVFIQTKLIGWLIDNDYNCELYYG
jgi:hypothetical protein